MIEEWKDIPGYEGLYRVSSEGKIKRLPSIVTRVLHGKEIQQRVPEKQLSTNGTYPGLSICKDGIPKRIYVHHVVADVFLGPRPEGMQVCHNDGNPKNPSLNNLRYDTPVGNAEDRHLHGTHAKGEHNPVNKYDEEMIANIKHDLLHYPSHKVAEFWDMPKSTVRGIKQEQNWAFVKPIPEEPLVRIEF